jgi:hypothetical protein
MTSERISAGIPEKSKSRDCCEDVMGESTGVLTADGLVAVVIGSAAGCC